MLAELRSLFEAVQTDGVATLEYDTKVYLGPL
jgi:hypothetical protein